MEKGKNEKVCQAVKAYFKYEGIAINTVAERLNATPRAVSAQLAGRAFSAKTAEKYAKEFGFNEAYLLTGEGALIADNHPHFKTTEDTGDLSRLIRIIESQQETIAVLAQKVP